MAGGANCAHAWDEFERNGMSGGIESAKVQIKGQDNFQAFRATTQAYCRRCGAWRGQLGLEPRLDCLGWATGAPCGVCYLCHLLAVFDEVWRVLRRDGLCFVNIADSYAGSMKGWAPNGPGYGGPKQKTNVGSMNLMPTPEQPGLKPKDLCQVPARFSLGMQAKGWYLRSAIVLAKGAPMPESTTDRPTRAYEMLFMFSKAARYYCDMCAVREAFNRMIAPEKTDRGHLEDRSWDNPAGRNLRDWWQWEPAPSSEVYCAQCDRLYDRAPVLPKCWSCGAVFEAPLRKYRRDAFRTGVAYVEQGQSATDNSAANFHKDNCPQCGATRVGHCPTCGGELSAHYAAYPPFIPRNCIKMGTSERGACAKCGTPYQRITKSTTRFEGGSGKAGIKTAEEMMASGKWLGNNYGANIKLGPVVDVQTLGWRQGCSCKDAGPPVPCIVLDIFSGVGTSVKEAERLGRRGIGLELSGGYARQSRHRTAQAGLFA